VIGFPFCKALVTQDIGQNIEFSSLQDLPVERSSGHWLNGDAQITISGRA